jgi:hypothetical protein
VGLSRMPMARNRRVTTAPLDSVPVADHVTRSLFHGNASVIWRATFRSDVV